jgi:hypothetical protein
MNTFMKAKIRTELTAVGIVIAAFALASTQAIAGDAVLEQYLEQFKRPSGFHFGVFAKVPEARSGCGQQVARGQLGRVLHIHLTRLFGELTRSAAANSVTESEQSYARSYMRMTSSPRSRVTKLE